jgi:hypothetical protein
MISRLLNILIFTALLKVGWTQPTGISNVKTGLAALGVDTPKYYPIVLDSVPPSDIDIPVAIALQSIYKMAEGKVPKEYKSVGYPNDWVKEACDTRYMYRFRRGPFRFKVTDNVLLINFTGYYQVKGSQRICTDGGTILSPWTPACGCGYDKDGEKKVEVGFKVSFNINPDFTLASVVERLEPLPVDKCEVCIFKKDITTLVMNSLKLQLDDSKKNMQQQLAAVNLKAGFQKLWDQLNTSWKASNAGWLKINPISLRMSPLKANMDTLHLSLGLTAKPVLTSAKPLDQPSALPNINNVVNKPGFAIFTEAELQYDSLGAMITEQVKGKTFEFDYKKSKKYIIINNCNIVLGENQTLVVKLDFDGSHKGILYLKGKPVYDEKTNVLTIKDLDFDIKKNFLLSTIEWLFNKKILKELRQYSVVDLTQKLDTMRQTLSAQLNREVYKGVFTHGQVSELKVLKFQTLSDRIALRCSMKGDLDVLVNNLPY